MQYIMKYEFSYAGRKISHRGIPRMDWQNFLFEKWQEEYGEHKLNPTTT